MAFISRGSEIPFVAYFIYKDTSNFVIEQQDFFPQMDFQQQQAEEEGYSFGFGMQTDVCL